MRLLAIAGTVAFAVSSISAEALAADGSAIAHVKLTNGTDIGTITISEATAGVILKIELSGLAPGPHGLHVHEFGKCEGDFSSAGAIYNPLGAKHGFLNDEGPMAGDLPNVVAGPDGSVHAELLSPFLTLSKEAEESLLDSDGSALVIYDQPDDYLTDPEGGSELRIACGVLTAK